MNTAEMLAMISIDIVAANNDLLFSGLRDMLNCCSVSEEDHSIQMRAFDSDFRVVFYSEDDDIEVSYFYAGMKVHETKWPREKKDMLRTKI